MLDHKATDGICAKCNKEVKNGSNRLDKTISTFKQTAREFREKISKEDTIFVVGKKRHIKSSLINGINAV